MLYRTLRAAGGVALRWYYADLVVQGAERIPAAGPVLVTSNHPNALVDALVVAAVMPRRVRLTAKATLFDQPLLAPLLRAVGVVPLRRAKDELAARRDGAASADRNADSFRQVAEALIEGGLVLVFPEGISHDQPALAPLKTGAARMALTAADAGARGVRVLPVGLIFERKEQARSRVLVRIGEPIDVDAWQARTSGDVARLTSDIDEALRHVTLNFASEARASRAVAMARALAAITEAPPALGHERSLATEAELARRVEVATEALESAPPAVAREADAFVARVESLERRLRERGASLTDVLVSPALRHGARFVLREALIVAVALPFALLGRLVHWLPLRTARALAMRSLSRDPSRDQPAMRTIVLGLAFVVLWYLLLAALVTHWFGAPAAVVWVAVLFLSARIDFALRDRVRRAARRARTYLALRKDPALRARSLADIDALVAEARALETALVATLASLTSR
jgi:glycerol-3-phosphate O-acyltransferase / dihydroxyacetone phosphate acyltransferase